MNLNRGIIPPLLVFLVLLVITGAFAQRTESSKTVLGVIAPIFPPAFLTFYLIMLLIFGKTIIDALAAFFAAAPKDAHHTSGLWFFASLIAVLLVTITIVVLMRTSPATLFGVLNAIQETVIIFRSAVSFSQFSVGRNQTPSAQMLFLTYYSFFAFGAIVTTSAILLLAGFRRAVAFNREDSNLGYAVPEKAAEIVGRAVTTLQSGADYQDVIIACYKQMCIILAHGGLEIGLTQTAREFAEQVCRKLRIGKEAVRGLTFLFEEARYSQHSVGNDKRSTALSQLASLKRELTRVDRII